LTALAHHVCSEWQLRAESRRLRGLAARAGEVDRLKDEFVTLVRHELRTPLTSIRAYLQELSEQGPQDPGDAAELLEVVSRNSDRLIVLIDSLLTIAETTSGGLRLDLVDVDIAVLLRQLVAAAAPVAEQRQLTLSIDAVGPVRVRADPVRLTQAIDHLLFNAMKFTPAHGRVHVCVAPGPPAVIEVCDTGAGIALDVQEHLFDAFYRTDASRAGHVPGAGLGLAVVKAVVTAHDGDITLDSRPGHGATFRIALPAGGDDPGRLEHHPGARTIRTSAGSHLREGPGRTASVL
jgi:signal transduction histidine kinase